LQAVVSDAVRGLVACYDTEDKVADASNFFAGAWRYLRPGEGRFLPDGQQTLDDAWSLAAPLRLAGYIKINSESVVTRTEQCYRFPFGSLPNDAEACARLSDFVASNLLGGAVVHVRGFLDRQFLEWMRSSGPDSRSPMSHVTLVYDLRLSDGSYYPMVLNTALSPSSQRLLKPELCCQADVALVVGAHRALQAAQGIQDTPWLWDPNGCVERETRSAFSKDLREIRSAKEIADWERVCCESIAKAITTRHEHSVSRQRIEAPTVVPSWEEFKEALRADIKELSTSPLNPRPEGIYLDDSEVETFIENQGRTLFRLEGEFCEHLANARLPTPESSRRESLGYNGPKEGFMLRPEYRLIDMVVDFRRKVKYADLQPREEGSDAAAIDIPARIGRSYDLTMPRISDIRRLLEEDPPKRTVSFRVSNDLTGSELSGEGRESLIKAERQIHLETLAFIDGVHREHKGKLPQFGEYSQRGRMVNREINNRLKREGHSLVLEAPELPSLEKLFSGYEEQLRAWRNQALGQLGAQLRNKSLSPAERKSLYEQKQAVTAGEASIASVIAGWRTATYNMCGNLIPWELFAGKSVKYDITDQAIAKFIYVIKPNGEVPIARESLGNDGNVVRPTHSQL
jgi:hypothetical protein